MNGIVISINPVALEIGDFSIRWYSLAIMLAVIVAVFIAAREAKAKGFSVNDIYGLVPWILVAGLIGARLFHVIDRWDDYSGNLLVVFQFQQGGLAIWGALIGGGLATILYTRFKHIPLSRMLDVLVPALLVAQIIGRFGCTINGDAYGATTGLPWGFIYVHPDALVPSYLVGIPTHPYPVYEQLWNGIALVLTYVFKNKIRVDGLLFIGYLAHYSLGRFFLSFVRQENALLGGLQQAQVLAIIGIVVSVAVIIYIAYKTRHTGKIENRI
jgi:phosphatidylglycerol:prolipoprotein diacylglycerol transferase